MLRSLVLSASDGKPLKNFKYRSDLGILVGKRSVDEKWSMPGYIGKTGE